MRTAPGPAQVMALSLLWQRYLEAVARSGRRRGAEAQRHNVSVSFAAKQTVRQPGNSASPYGPFPGAQRPGVAEGAGQAGLASVTARARGRWLGLVPPGLTAVRRDSPVHSAASLRRARDPVARASHTAEPRLTWVERLLPPLGGNGDKSHGRGARAGHGRGQRHARPARWTRNPAPHWASAVRPRAPTPTPAPPPRGTHPDSKPDLDQDAPVRSSGRPGGRGQERGDAAGRPR